MPEFQEVLQLESSMPEGLQPESSMLPFRLEFLAQELTCRLES
jgi:hypothetical protein